MNVSMRGRACRAARCFVPGDRRRGGRRAARCAAPSIADRNGKRFSEHTAADCTLSVRDFDESSQFRPPKKDDCFAMWH
jgi:hypothetical protein